MRLLALLTQPLTPQGSRRTLEDKLDKLMERRHAEVLVIAQAETKKKAAIAEANAAFTVETEDAIAKRQEVDGELAAFLVRHRYSLVRRLSKTIRRQYGEIKFVLRAKELDLPEDETTVVEALLAMRGGKRYLRKVWKLNKDALAQAPDSTIQPLWPLGVWRGQHRTISIKSVSEKMPSTLSRRRHREKRH